MGQLLVKTIGNDTPRVPVEKHAIANMPNGALAVLWCDNNLPAITSGGNQSGSSLVYVYTTTTYTRVAWNTPVSWSFNAVASSTKVGKASMAIDVAGNLHVAYVYYDATGLESVRYRKLTYASGNYTVGAEQIVSAGVADRFVVGIDIDSVCDSVDFPIIAVAYRTGPTTFISTLIVYNRNAAAWPAVTLRTATENGQTPDICITARTGTAVSTQFQYVVSFNPGPVPSIDPGDYIYTARAIVGGAHTASSTVAMYSGLSKKYNAGYRNYDIYALSQDVYMIYGTIQSYPHKAWYALVQTSATSNTWSVKIAPRVIDYPATYSRFSHKVMSSSMVRDIGSTTSGTIFAFNYTNKFVYFTTHEWSVSGSTWKVTENKVYKRFSQGYSVASNLLGPYAGDRGVFNPYSSIDVAVPYTKNTGAVNVQKLYLYKRTERPSVEITTPSENGSVATNRPDIIATVTGKGVDAGNYRTRVQVQLSQSSTFATGVTTVTQDPALEAYYSTTPTAVKISLADYPLSQGTWYARSRIVDQMENTGSWSTTRKFKISHAPKPINLGPRDASVLIYSASGSTFTWKFTDAYAQDYQTAIQIQTYDTNENIVTDTGKVSVAKEITEYTLVIPSSAIDTYLDWYMTVWDADNVSSNATYGGTVFLTGVPAPVITAPAVEGEDITTASPTFSWTSGITGAKTQASFRVQLRVKGTGRLVFDTLTIEDDATSYTMSTGVLQNGVSYDLALTVEDSVGLSATVTRGFDVAWVVPAAGNRPTVFLDSYEKYGYATVRVSTTGYDTDLVQFNLYRRTLDGSAQWKLVDERVSTMPSYVFKDYLLPAGVTSEYAVTQVVNRFGDLMESAVDLAPRAQVNPQNSNYWLVSKNTPDESLLLPNVTSDSLIREIEEEVYNVINRGRQVEVGENIGISGTINSQIRNKDIGHGGYENYNLVPNSNLDTDEANAIPGWTRFDTGTQANGYVDSQEEEVGPGPAGREDRFSITTKRDANATAVYTRVGYYSAIPQSSYNPLTVGQQYYISGWFNITNATPGYFIYLYVDMRAGSTAVTGQTQNAVIWNSDPAVTNTGIIETRVVGDNTWIRLGRSVVVPAGGVDNVRFNWYVSTSNATTALAPITVAAEGLMMTLGAAPIQYFNGDQPGMSWIGDDKFSPSYTPGILTARAIRQRIEALKMSQNDLYLRNPFGDVWPVYVSGIQVDRVAGVGSAEFVDITVPYFELMEVN
jgi:hypothetical protein